MGYGVLRPTSDVGAEIVPISYPGVKVIEGSPAPYGLPLIPLEVTDDGVLRGIPDAAEDQLSWYKYCSHERAPGTFPGFDSDDVIRYFAAGATAEASDRWFGDRLGEPVRVEDFPDTEPNAAFADQPGVGAPFQWRSEGVPAESKITGLVIRFPKRLLSFDDRVPSQQADRIRDQWFPEDPGDPEMAFLGTCSFCTHFCCVPGFHTSQVAADRAEFADKIFCTCHLSRYDPFTIQTYNRTIFQFPGEEDGMP